MQRQHALFGNELERYIRRVREAAGEARDLRYRTSNEAHLRDMSAWTALRAAQAWIAKNPPPRQAWQGERVRRAALEMGYARPVMEGRHVGLIRPCMTFNQLTHDVTVFPDGIIGRRIPPIASSLLHEATHAVHREAFCERFELASDEAFILCDVNVDESPTTVFTAEALAFWNEACWMITGSPEDVGECGQDEMLIRAANAVTRPSEATEEFASALTTYTEAARSGQRSPLKLPVLHLRGPRAGLPIVASDLAPSILEPLLGLASL